MLIHCTPIFLSCLSNAEDVINVDPLRQYSRLGSPIILCTDSVSCNRIMDDILYEVDRIENAGELQQTSFYLLFYKIKATIAGKVNTKVTICRLGKRRSPF